MAPLKDRVILSVDINRDPTFSFQRRINYFVSIGMLFSDFTADLKEK